MMMTFDFEAIERRVRASGMELEDFYARIDVHRTTWQRWKRGKFSPRLSVIAKIEEIVPGAAA
jgi:hypothetical protein